MTKGLFNLIIDYFNGLNNTVEMLRVSEDIVDTFIMEHSF